MNIRGMVNMYSNLQNFKKQKNHILSLILALLSTVGVSYYFLSCTGNISNICFFIIFSYVYITIGFNGNKRQKCCSVVLALIYSFVIIIGKIGRSDENILDALKRYTDTIYKDAFNKSITLSGWKDAGDIIMLLFMFIGLSIVFYFLFMLIIKIIENQKYNGLQNNNNFNKTKLFLISFIVILLCWMPYFVVAYPGVLTYDSINQLQQVEGLEPLSNHHPLIHTFFIKIFYTLGKSVGGSSNVGVATYIFVQMCILSAIYSFLIKILYENNLKLKYCILILVFFALPINAIYAITMLKNSLYASFILLFAIALFLLFVCKKVNTKTYVLFFFSALLVTMFRSNGRIVYVLCIPFILYFSRKYDRKNKLKLIIIAFVPLIVSLFITNVVYKGFRFDSHDIIESLHMPVQHISRVVVDCEDELTDNEKEEIEKFFVSDLQKIKDTYNCRHANPIKELLRSENKDKVILENKVEFMMFYLKLGVKHPLTYLKAELDSTVGYYNSDIQYIYTIMYGVYENDLGITALNEEESEIYKRMVNVCEIFRYIPLLGNLYNPPSILFLAIGIITIYIYFRKYSSIITFIPIFADLITILLAAPIHAQTCYVYSMIVNLPFMLAVFYLFVVEKNYVHRF